MATLKTGKFGQVSPAKAHPSNFKISYGKAGDVQGTSKASKQIDREIAKLRMKGKSFVKGQ
jgi:hypothetical protein